MCSDNDVHVWVLRCFYGRARVWNLTETKILAQGSYTACNHKIALQGDKARLNSPRALRNSGRRASSAPYRARDRVCDSVTSLDCPDGLQAKPQLPGSVQDPSTARPRVNKADEGGILRSARSNSERRRGSREPWHKPTFKHNTNNTITLVGGAHAREHKGITAVHPCGLKPCLAQRGLQRMHRKPGVWY